MKFMRRALVVWLFLVGAWAVAADYTGRVVGVSDGDTLTLLTADKQQVKVRLGEIDTPESRQPYGERAKQVLSALAFGKEARVVVQDTDKYGRTVGRVYVGTVDVNAEMVKQGAAWVYRQYVWPLGAPGSGTLSSLGLAAWNLPHGVSVASALASGPDQRELHLREQTHLPANGQL